MKSVSKVTSASYEEFIIEKLKQPEHAAGFLEAILTEKNPEATLLSQALAKVIQAYQQENKLSDVTYNHYQNLQEILAKTGSQEIYYFIELLQQLGFKISIEVESFSS